MENNKWDHGVNREYMGVCVQLRGALNIRGRDVDLILHAKLLQLCQTLCEPMDCSPPGSSVHGTLQARILEWVAMPFSRDLPHPGIEPGSPVSPALAAGVFTTEPPGKPALLMGFPGGSDGE